MSEEVADSTTEYGAGLIDVSGLDLHDLDEMGESSLDHALRLLADDENTGPVAGFQSSI
ncbi:FxSxx-COOH cyclophane-containing RiPP peptide [Planomonospora parontospora]|uniref:FxSxx-COOH cyclophane-containing RiPP peptide n=1 Tax=Planomonospora parontospora TaxID=58119 RepID=UPI001EF41BC0|nr:FxSxx-COOH cyclophane-containing RiPP peptide [Planomonospora parontospora]